LLTAYLPSKLVYCDRNILMTAKNSEFFQLAPIADTLTRLFEHIQPLTTSETIPVADALGRVVSEPPRSPVDLPTFIRSTMDGYAVRAEDTFGASQTLPAYLTLTTPVIMGEAPTHTVQTGEASSIHTGGMLPDGANAVVMIEKTQTIDETEIEVLGAVAPGENLVQVGEDVASGAAILDMGHVIRPQDIGGLLAVGVLTVNVRRRPVVAIMGSGDEIVAPEQEPAYGQIRDINSYTLAALCNAAGAEVRLLGVAADTLEAISDKAAAGIAGADMLIMTAGSSVSTRDYTRTTIEALGSPGVIQHGLAVKPGKPAIIAACDGKPVIGLPGNPVSAMLVARQVVIPTLYHLMGQSHPHPVTVEAQLTANIPSTTGREDTVPVKLTQVESGQWMATPQFGKSNLIYTLVGADGLVTVPLNSNGLRNGESVHVSLF
jgi:molybdopterin molybdotransferase